MASAYMELTFCSKVFNKKTFDLKKYNETMYKYKSKIMDYFEVYGKTKLEIENNNTYELIDTKVKKGYIHNFGIARLPIVKDKNRYLTYKEIYGMTDVTNINGFDYVIFIPKSRFHYAFYL